MKQAILVPDTRLPYVVVGSVEFGTDAMRLLRCTTDGKIASGSENYDAPVLNIPISFLTDEVARLHRVVTPDEVTVSAIRKATGVAAHSIDDFERVVVEIAGRIGAKQRETTPRVFRNASDSGTSAFATAQRLHALLSRQMPRVQVVAASPPRL